MSEFGTRAWFDDLSARAAIVVTGFDPPLVVEQRVSDVPAGGIDVWHLRLAATVEVVEGTAQHATVTLTCDAETARGLSSGTTNAQQAISAGRLQVSGDIAALVAAAPTLAALGAFGAPDGFATDRTGSR